MSLRLTQTRQNGSPPSCRSSCWLLAASERSVHSVCAETTTVVLKRVSEIALHHQVSEGVGGGHCCKWPYSELNHFLFSPSPSSIIDFYSFVLSLSLSLHAMSCNPHNCQIPLVHFLCQIIFSCASVSDGLHLFKYFIHMFLFPPPSSFFFVLTLFCFHYLETWQCPSLFCHLHIQSSIWFSTSSMVWFAMFATNSSSTSSTPFTSLYFSLP